MCLTHSLSVNEFLARKINHGPGIPHLYLIPCDFFFLLHTMPKHLNGFRFETIKEIRVTMAIVKNLQENDFWKLAKMLEFM
jgi:hypothetical protein